MKRLALIWLFICAFLFTGCQRENTLSENSTNSDISLESFDFSCSINVFRNDNDSLIPCGYSFDTPENNFLPLTVSTKVSPDKSVESNDIPMRIYVFGNGVPLDFCLKNNTSGSKFSKIHELSVNKDVDNTFDISINLDIGEEIHILSILCDYFPEDIPQKGLGSYSGCIVYSMVNTQFKQKPHIDDIQNRYYNSEDKEFGFDIGKNTLSENNSAIAEHHFYDDVTVSDAKEGVYIKFNSGAQTDIPFYIILFYDGELISPFEGYYSRSVDCASGKKSFQYQIPMNYFETDGLHTFRAVALPAFGRISNGKIEMPYYSTNKVRVQVLRGT